MNSNVINYGCLISSDAINQMFFRCRSSIEKYFSCIKGPISQRDIWESKFSQITCYRMSENALLRSSKHVYIIALHLAVENMILLSSLYCTNLKKLKTRIFKEETL